MRGVVSVRAVMASLVVAMAATPVLAQFRVNPYLQQPSSDGMLFTWFSEQNLSGSIAVTGPGLAAPLMLNSAPAQQQFLAYTAAELAQTIPGLPQGSWLYGSSNNFKHSVDVRGLQPNSQYTYTVNQGGGSFSRTFKTAPTAADWTSVRFIAMSDSETEPAGRTTRREWNPGALAAGSEPRPALTGSQWANNFGTLGSGSSQTLRYAITEAEGYKANQVVVDSRDPAFIVKPGDLVQGGGYQPGWDEFFRHNAGEFDDTLSKRPILPAIGNWETFAAINGGYGTPTDRTAVVRSRQKYKSYFDMPSNGTPEHQDNYYRTDYGPITVITLDSSNGSSPEDSRANYPAASRLTGQQYTGPGTDTQENFTGAEYATAAATLGVVNDHSDFNPGSTQWNWARAQLEDARARGQVVFVQFHHSPFSSGEHGLPMNHRDSSGQGGTPMRQYHPMFEQFGVAAVLSGHSEMFERSFVDSDGNGTGVNYYDVGVSGDGLRGERRNGTGFGAPLLKYNEFSKWTSDQSEGELWATVDGVQQLIDGGKHYGHLEVNVTRITNDPTLLAEIVLTPVYVFPVLDSSYNVISNERRVYGDEIRLFILANGSVVPEPGALGLLVPAGMLLVRRRR